MKSIERRYLDYKEKNTTHGDYVCLANAVKGQNFTRITIGRWLSKLIPKDERRKKDVERLIDHLEELSKGAEDDKNQGVVALRKNEKRKVEESIKKEVPGSPEGDIIKIQHTQNEERN